jgi:hypothetical protein
MRILGSEEYARKRLLLAEIAREEGAKGLAGDERLAGPAIEKYLSVFRVAFNHNGGTVDYSDLKVGYPWCCAFVYYCCRQAGFVIPPKPIPEHRWTLGVVRVWRDWAVSPDNQFYFAADDPSRKPHEGDLVLFNRLLEDRDLDHIGIVVDTLPDAIVTAEGNVHNRSGVFVRPLGPNINGFIRLENC